MQARILENGAIRATRRVDELERAHARGLPFWLEIEERTAEIDDFLSRTLKLHSLTIEDVWGDRSSPKIDEFEHYLYVLVHALKHVPESKDLSLLEVDVVVGPTFVVTHDSAQCVSEELQKDDTRLA